MNEEEIIIEPYGLDNFIREHLIEDYELALLNQNEGATEMLISAIQYYSTTKQYDNWAIANQI